MKETNGSIPPLEATSPKAEASAKSRRGFLKTGLFGSAGAIGALTFLRSAPSMAQAGHQGGLERSLQCAATPVQPEGPFYPINDQLDKDSDLTLVQGGRAAAKGRMIYVMGRVTDEACAPVAGVLVEIWQACESGRYNHVNDPNPAPLDPNFQYFGKAITDANGRYVFKTILPGAYPAGPGWVRPPHIHFRVLKTGYRELITQLYFAGDALNDKDRILRSLSRAEQAQVVIPLVPAPEDVFGPGAIAASFDISLTRP